VRFFLCVFTIFVGLMATGCVAPALPDPPPVKPGSRLHLFLQPLPQEAHRLNLTLSAVKARRDDGTVVVLHDAPLPLNPQVPIGVQRKLLTAVLPHGRYQGLEITIVEASLLTDEGRVDLLLPEEALFVPEEFTIESQQALALFLSLSGDRLVSAGYRLTPRFSLYKPQPPLPGLKGVVSESWSGTISVFEKTTPEVVSVVALGTVPKDLVLDPERRWVYAALEGRDAIVGIDLVTETVQSQISLRPGDDPREIALSPDRQTLACVNTGSNSLSLIDARSLYEKNRVRFSSVPSAVFFGGSGDQVFVLHNASNTLSLVDAGRGEEVASIKLGEAPVRGAASPDGRFLYIITEDSPDLLVVDSSTLTLIGRKYVGYGALCLSVNPVNGLVYIGQKSGEVVILDTALDVPIDRFRLRGAVSDLSIDVEENTLFAALPILNRVEKYDLVSKKHLGGIDIGPGGYAVAVMGEE